MPLTTWNSTARVARELDMSRESVLLLIHKGTLPAERIGERGHWRIARQAVERLFPQTRRPRKDRDRAIQREQRAWRNEAACCDPPSRGGRVIPHVPARARPTP